MEIGENKENNMTNPVTPPPPLPTTAVVYIVSTKYHLLDSYKEKKEIESAKNAKRLPN